MPTWFLLALLSLTALAVAELTQKHLMSHKVDISAEANNFIVWTLQGILAFLFVIIFPVDIPTTVTTSLIIQLFILGAIYFWAGTFYYTSFKHGSASVSIIIASISIAVSTLLGIFIFGESTFVVKFFGILLIVTAIIFLKAKNNITLTNQMMPALIGGGLYGLAYTIDKHFSIQLNPHIYHIFFAFSIALNSLLFRFKKVQKDTAKVTRTLLSTMFLSAVMFFVYNKFTFMAYASGGEVGRLDAINNSAIFLVLLFEIIVFKDRKQLLLKVICATLAFFGVLILGFT